MVLTFIYHNIREDMEILGSVFYLKRLMLCEMDL